MLSEYSRRNVAGVCTCWQCGQVQVGAGESFGRRLFIPCFTRLVARAGCRGGTVANVPTDFRRALFFVSALEQFIPADQLRATPVADLHPGRIVVLNRVPAEPVLGYDALQVTLAAQLEEPLAFGLDVVQIENAITVPQTDLARTLIPKTGKSQIRVTLCTRISGCTELFSGPQKLLGGDVWRGRKIAVFQPLHANVLTPAVFRKFIQIGHEDLHAGFGSHARVAVH